MTEAGRELDALVGAKVLGLNVCPLDGRHGGTARATWMSDDLSDYGTEYCYECSLRCSEPYSTDIKAAWEVVEKLKLQGNGNDGWFFVLHYDNAEIWDAQFYKESRADGGMYAEEKWGCASTAPLAICLAALKAVGYEPDKETR